MMSSSLVINKVNPQPKNTKNVPVPLADCSVLKPHPHIKRFAHCALLCRLWLVTPVVQAFSELSVLFRVMGDAGAYPRCHREKGGGTPWTGCRSVTGLTEFTALSYVS